MKCYYTEKFTFHISQKEETFGVLLLENIP